MWNKDILQLSFANSFILLAVVKVLWYMPFLRTQMDTMDANGCLTYYCSGEKCCSVGCGASHSRVMNEGSQAAHHTERAIRAESMKQGSSRAWHVTTTSLLHNTSSEVPRHYEASCDNYRLIICCYRDAAATYWTAAAYFSGCAWVNISMCCNL